MEFDEAMMERVAIYDACYDDSLRGVMRRVLDDSRLEVAGKTVFVKPNILGPFECERGITTHPRVVEALVRELSARGARVSVGDNPGMRGYGSNVGSAKACGIYDVCPDEFVNISEAAVRMPLKGACVDEVTISKRILDADLYISVPKFKTHLLTTITGAVKNSYGMLVGGQKAEIHRIANTPMKFAGAVVDVYQIRPPDFVVVDAVVGMEGKGPSSDELREIGKIISGSNGVAVDAVMALMMGVRPRSINMLRVAAERKLGPIEKADISIEGSFSEIEGFKLPSKLLKSIVGITITNLLTYLMVDKPYVHKEICTRCGICAEQCPVGAITMKPFPVIDRRKCISCFCCSEFCKDNAMDISRRVKLARRKMKY